MIPGITPKLDIRAKVRTGKKVNGRPQATDYFTSLDSEFTDKLGAPKSLVITLPFKDPDMVMPTSLELWGANGVLKCWCNDAETAHRLGTKGAIDLVPCTHPECQQFAQHNCFGVGRFRFSIPQLGEGIFQIDTKSKHSIESIMGTLAVYPPTDPERRWALTLTKKQSGTNKWNVLTLTPILIPDEEPDE